MADSNVRTFLSRLDARARDTGSLVCVGLDPLPRLMPAGLPATADGVVALCTAIIDATADLALAFKPNLAFFAALGRDGFDALYRIRAAIPTDIPMILDCKSGDMASTAAAYAAAWFDALGADAVTVNPYQGEDSIEPFLRYSGKGVFILTKTSNPGSGDLQDHHLAETGEPLYLHVARRAARWNATYPADVGLVVGATFPDELAGIRAAATDLPILLPGLGAQGGDLERSLEAGLRADGLGLLCSSSRGIMYASTGADYADAARIAATDLRDRIAAIRRGIPAPAL